MRKIFQEVLADLLEENLDIHLLLGDIGVYGFSESMKQFPDRVLNMGIMEQSMVGFAAGLSKAGAIPVVHTISPFLVERPLEQLKIDFGYHNLVGNFVSVGGSFDYSKLGATHHCPADIEILASIPNFDIWCPAGDTDLEAILRTEITKPSLTYVRLSERGTQLRLRHQEGACLVKEGRLNYCVAIGDSVDDTLQAVEGTDIGVISWISPRSPAGLISILRRLKVNRVSVIEPFYEGSSAISLLPYVSEFSIEFIGVKRQFMHAYGDLGHLKEIAGIDPKSIQSRLRFLEF